MLEEPYPSFPFKKASSKYEVRAYSRDDKFMLTLYNARYAAARYVKEIIGDDDIEWKSTTTLVTASGYKLVSVHLEELVEHEDTAEQSKWHPTIPQTTYLDTFLGRGRQHTPTRPDSVDDNVRGNRAGTGERKEARSRAPTAPRSDDMVGIADITNELKMDPRDARQILRKNVEKPAHGWAWVKEEAVKIKKLLMEKRK